MGVGGDMTRGGRAGGDKDLTWGGRGSGVEVNRIQIMFYMACDL